MAGIRNNSERQYNLKCIDKKTKHRVTVRLAPGFNVIPDNHWSVVKESKYVINLKTKGIINFDTEELDNMEIDAEPDTVAKSKSVPPPSKPKEDSK